MAQREVERLKEQLASGPNVTTESCHPAEGTSRVRITHIRCEILDPSSQAVLFKEGSMVLYIPLHLLAYMAAVHFAVVTFE